MLTALLLAYRTNWTDFYYNTGFCYDLLCFTLYFGALFVYFRARLAGQILTRKELLIFFALFWLGLSAKEMIVSIPPVIAAAELFWLDRSDSLRRRLLPALITSVAVLVFIVGRLYSPPDGLANLELYRPNISVAQFIHQGGLFVRDFLDVIHVTRTVPMAVLFTTLVLTGLVSNQIAPRVGVAVALLLGVLPVIFINHRQLAAAYLPCAGFALLLAWALVETTRPFFPFRWRAVALFLTAFVVSWHLAYKSPPDLSTFTKDAQDIQRAVEGIRALNLQPPHHSRILMEKDPIPQFRWGTNFLFGFCTTIRRLPWTGSPNL